MCAGDGVAATAARGSYKEAGFHVALQALITNSDTCVCVKVCVLVNVCVRACVCNCVRACLCVHLCTGACFV
jgi:hypothetical protein